MNNQDFCRITPTLSIPFSELSFTFSRSSGKGGQHVNKVNTRVTLWFDIESSGSLTREQKDRIGQRLAGRINKRGVLQLDADRRRSQSGNREEVMQRFASLLREALHVEKRRRKSRPSHAAKQRRLQAKKHRSRLKQQRGRKNFSDH